MREVTGETAYDRYLVRSRAHDHEAPVLTRREFERRRQDDRDRRLVLPPERGIVAASHLMIVSPLQPTGVVRLFSSHPPMAERVARLERRAGDRR